MRLLRLGLLVALAGCAAPDQERPRAASAPAHALPGPTPDEPVPQPRPAPTLPVVITVQVLDGSEPARDAWLELSGIDTFARDWTVTDLEGRARLDMKTSPAELTVAPRFAPERFARERRILDASSAAEPVVIRIHPLAELAGKVIDELGKPVVDAAVESWNGPFPTGTVRTNSRGAFRFHLFAHGERYRLRARKGSASVEREAIAPGEDVQLVLQQVGVLHVNVPVDGSVRIRYVVERLDGTSWRGVRAVEVAGPPPHTLFDLPAGTIRVKALVPGHGWGCSPPSSLSDEASVRVGIAAGHRVTGRTVDSLRRPLVATVVQPDWPNPTAKWGSDGSFVIEDLPTEVTRLVFSCEGFAPAEEVVSAETADLGDVVLLRK